MSSKTKRGDLMAEMFVGIGLHLFKAGLEVARAMRIPVVMGVFSNYKIQDIAKRIGMKVKPLT